jgi:hypothetical protein
MKFGEGERNCIAMDGEGMGVGCPCLAPPGREKGRGRGVAAAVQDVAAWTPPSFFRL